ncbi:smoothelin-like protein 1 isoform X1 [Pleurodeles waltl]|uniref:smoothelin-like protein 1 isoform X1 n=1 Tax=Pleurodeles waltl TaxID=8319 RepID=UPI0037097911
MEQPSKATPTELPDEQSLVHAEETLGDAHRDQTEEPAGDDHLNTSKIDGDVDPEQTPGAPPTDTSQEETPRSDTRDTTQKLSGDHNTDGRTEKAPGVCLGNTSPHGTMGAHLTERSQEDPSGTDHCDTIPPGTPGAKDKDTVNEEPTVTQEITEPEATPPDPEEREGNRGEAKQKEPGKDKKEGDNTLLGEASEEKEEATEEVEVGEEEKHADVKSGAQATEDPAEESTSPAEEPSSPVDEISSPVEEGRRAEDHPEEEAESTEPSLEEGPGSPEVGPKAGDTQPDGKAQGSAAGVGATAEGTEPGETDKPPAPEKKKRDVGRSRTIPKSYGSQSRKAIMEKFGGPAAGPAPGVKVQRSTSFGASGVKNMLLEWCKAKTRDYEHVDIQNFSSSWSSGMAFCALVHKFFPDEFDYATLDPKNRRQNFELAFSTADSLSPSYVSLLSITRVSFFLHSRLPFSYLITHIPAFCLLLIFFSLHFASFSFLISQLTIHAHQFSFPLTHPPSSSSQIRYCPLFNLTSY